MRILSVAVQFSIYQRGVDDPTMISLPHALCLDSHMHMHLWTVAHLILYFHFNGHFTRSAAQLFIHFQLQPQLLHTS